MKKTMVALLLGLSLLFCAGCTPKETTLPGEYPMEFLFSSGAGAWGTRLTLNADGSFEGNYHDSEMGLTGEGYPNGTVYICTFHGQFTDARPIDEYSYRLTLDSLTTDERPAEEIRDNILYAAAGPHGFTGSNPESSTLVRDFVLYTPETPVSGLDEDFLSWWPQRFSADPPETLGCFALWNTEGGYGFFTYPAPQPDGGLL